MFYVTDQNLLKEEEEEEDKTVEPDAPPLGTGRIKMEMSEKKNVAVRF